MNPDNNTIQQITDTAQLSHFYHQKLARNKTLVAGWFSFAKGHATAGDLLAMQVACEWLQDAGYSYDVSIVPPVGNGMDWQQANPADYSHVVFVCGPFKKTKLEAAFLRRFQSCCLIGLNLTMAAPMSSWKPFDLLIERNSTKMVRPDMVFLSKEPLVPVIGLCLLEENKFTPLLAQANEALKQLVASRQGAVLHIDTRLDKNSTHLRTPAEVESMVARVDVLITTRLHGAVKAIKNGVPVVALDPVAGGDKIWNQMQVVGWPHVYTIDKLKQEDLNAAFDYCLTSAAKEKAKACALQAASLLHETKKDFIQQLTTQGSSMQQNYVERMQKGKEEQWIENVLSQPKKRKAALHTTIAILNGILRKTSYWLLPAPVYNRLQISRKK